MTATSTERDTPAFGPTDPRPHGYPVLASTSVLKGALGVITAAGYAKDGVTGTGLFCVGRFAESKDNSNGSSGDLYVKAEEGEFRWVNGESITVANVGDPAFITDNQTVCLTGTSKSFAGIITKVDSYGVWVYSSLALSAMYAKIALAQTTASTPPTMQAVNGTIASGTVTLNSGFSLASNSEVIPVAKTVFSGTTNLAMLAEITASRVTGADGVATLVIKALGNDGAVDTDAAGSIRVIILTPQS